MVDLYQLCRSNYLKNLWEYASQAAYTNRQQLETIFIYLFFAYDLKTVNNLPGIQHISRWLSANAQKYFNDILRIFARRLV